MWRFLNALLDIILPRKARVVRIESYSIEDLLPAPEEHTNHGATITTLLSYRIQAVDDLIRALKYDRAKHASQLLAEVLAEYLREEISSLKTFSPKEIVLVPVPLHESRKRERGFNQVEVVLDHLPKEFKDGTLSRVDTRTLSRTRATPQQTRLSRSERLKNVAGAFRLNNNSLQKNRVILIDDVTTTGATLLAASEPLRKSGIAHSLIALAHA